MKSFVLVSLVVLSVACASSQPASAPASSDAPVAVATPVPSSGGVVPAPGATPSPALSCTERYGEGKENYCHIADAFVAKFGPPIPGKAEFYRNDAQWKEFEHLQGIESRGLVPLVKKYGCDPVKLGSPVVIPLFGPFTGAQHEFGGNMYLSAAVQLAGLSPEDLERWLLQGHRKFFTCVPPR